MRDSLLLLTALQLFALVAAQGLRPACFERKRGMKIDCFSTKCRNLWPLDCPGKSCTLYADFCFPGMVTRKDGKFCICIHFGIWACHSTACYEDKVCVPGEMKIVDCNRCVCCDTGIWACTTLQCDSKRSRCKPGSMKQEDCNFCRCLKDGEWSCTNYRCVKATEPCKVTDIRYEGSSVCHCTQAHEWTCIDNVRSGPHKRDVGRITLENDPLEESKAVGFAAFQVYLLDLGLENLLSNVTCTPHTLFERGCGMCVCDSAGSSAACTDLDCSPPGLTSYLEDGTLLTDVEEANYPSSV